MGVYRDLGKLQIVKKGGVGYLREGNGEQKGKTLCNSLTSYAAQEKCNSVGIYYFEADREKEWLRQEKKRLEREVGETRASVETRNIGLEVGIPAAVLGGVGSVYTLPLVGKFFANLFTKI